MGDAPASIPPPEVKVAAPVEPGTVLAGKYKVEKVLNSGGMGVILVAHHLQLDQRVAIKVLRTHALESPEIVARFAREARAAAKIKSEHVVRVIDVGSLDSGAPYMVMEYLSGSDLSALIKARGPIPYEEAVEYVLQACEALAEAHVARIVHRDLKPANLFLTRRPDGTPLVKVLDFGISKFVESADFENDSAQTKTSMIMGSPQYMSPEQLRSARRVDGRADVWALGIVLYRLLTAKNPFFAATTPELCVEILHGEPMPLLKLEPTLPKALDKIIDRCLKKKPSERYQTVLELAEALSPFAPARAQPSLDRIRGVYRGAPPMPPDDSSPLPVERVGDPTTTRQDELGGGGKTISESSVSVGVDFEPAPASPPAPRTKTRVVGALAIVMAVAASGVLFLALRKAPAGAPTTTATATESAPTASALALASVAAAAPSASVADDVSHPPASAAASTGTSVAPLRTRITPSGRSTAAGSGSTIAASATAPASAAPTSSTDDARFGGRK